jgi:hypothetical protein
MNSEEKRNVFKWKENDFVSKKLLFRFTLRRKTKEMT